MTAITQGLRKLGEATAVASREVVRIQVLLYLGHASSEPTTRFPWGRPREAVIQTTSYVADHSLVRVDIAEAARQPAAISIAVAEPARQLCFSEGLRESSSQTLASRRHHI